MKLILLAVLLAGCTQVKTKWGPWVVEKPVVKKDKVLHRKCRSVDMGAYTRYECYDEVEFITPAP